MEKEKKEFFSSLDIVYKPVSNIHQTIDCYIAKSVTQAYRGIVSKGKGGGVHSTFADQCYGCNKFLTEKNNLEKHLEICGSMPRLVYRFKNQSILTFEDNVKFMGDLHFSIYFYLETTSGKKIYEFEEAAEMYPISCLCCFLQSLLEPRPNICSAGSFNHTFEQLNGVSNLSNELLKFFNPIAPKQLRDCAKAIFDKKRNIFAN